MPVLDVLTARGKGMNHRELYDELLTLHLIGEVPNELDDAWLTSPEGRLWLASQLHGAVADADDETERGSILGAIRLARMLDRLDAQDAERRLRRRPFWRRLISRGRCGVPRP